MHPTPHLIRRQHGEGPSMLLIHGVGMCADYWQNIEAQLAQHFSLTVIDMPGHGESELINVDLTSDQSSLTHHQPSLAQYTDCIAHTLQQQKSPSIVVGHSMGALIALDLAVRYSDSISGIAVLNGVYRRPESAQLAIDSRVEELKLTLKNDPANNQHANNSQTLARWFGSNPTGINEKASTLCREWLANVNPLGYLQAYAAFAKADAPSNEQLQSISCPALFITGSQEPNSTPAMSTKMSDLVAGSRCEIIENAKHMMSMTHGESVCDAVVDYFSPPLNNTGR